MSCQSKMIDRHAYTNSKNEFVRFGSGTDKRRLRQSDVLQIFATLKRAWPGDNAIFPRLSEFCFSWFDFF